MIDVFTVHSSVATVVQQLNAWLDARPSHFRGLVTARRADGGGLSEAAAGRAVKASLAAVGSSTYLDVTAMRALALACGVEVHAFFAAHGAHPSQLVVFGIGGALDG